MFGTFGKSGDTKEPTQPGPQVNTAEAANAVTAKALRSLNPRDKDLTDRLELKSRLHEALLERLNLSVIDKVQTEELRREVANLAQAVSGRRKTAHADRGFQGHRRRVDARSSGLWPIGTASGRSDGQRHPGERARAGLC